MKHPELVNSTALEAVLRGRESLTNEWPGVELVEIHDGKVERRRTLNAHDLNLFFSKQRSPGCLNAAVCIRIFLLKSVGTVISPQGAKWSEAEWVAINPAILRTLRNEAGLSDHIIAAACGLGHWYTVKHAVFTDKDNKGQPKTLETYQEHRFDFQSSTASQFTTDFKTYTYFHLNMPREVLDRFLASIEEDPRLSSRLFFLDVLVADELMLSWQRDIKSKRDKLKSLEATGYTQVNKASIAALHSLSQDWHIHARNISDFDAFIKHIYSASSVFSEFSHQLEARPNTDISMKQHPALDESVKYLSSSCQSLKNLVADYQGRTNVQINLLFHLANQEETKASIDLAKQSKEIAELTAKVAQRTQRDSSSMITIAAVTMFFLPGTFIASIFSTIFFEFDEKSINVSTRWWIFPIVAIPLTVLVFIIWLTWLRWRQRHDV